MCYNKWSSVDTFGLLQLHLRKTDRSVAQGEEFIIVLISLQGN
jgi:hypothetical protein